MIREFLFMFNGYENGHIFVNGDYYPESIRGLCEFLETRNYVRYLGDGRWEKLSDIPSVEAVEREIAIFLRGHRNFMRRISTYLNTVFKRR